MSGSSQHLPTFNHYAFNLRDGLRQAAVSTLSELEQSISVQGYGWLDSYMESILSRQADENVPIAEYMKTPSRTQTVKKTRATTAAAKDRTEKVKGLNARLALSPANKQSSRPPLSPLQPRSLNTVALSPTPAQSPKASPLKAKPEKAKPKVRSKKTKSKKVADNDENSPPSSADTSLGNSGTSEASKSTSTSSRRGKKVETPEQAHENTGEQEQYASTSLSRSKRAEVVTETEEIKMADPEPEAEPLKIVEPTHIDESIEDEIIVDNVVPEPVRPTPKAEQPLTKDLSIIAERSEDGTSISSERNANNLPEIVQDDIVPKSVKKDNSAEPKEADADVHTQEEPEPVKPVPAPAQPEMEREHKVDPTMPASFASAPAPVSTGSSGPARQVRSSWLSKALGTGAMPISAVNQQDGSSAVRKSYAAPLQQRQSNAVDFSGVRKSLVPAGGLKRKSDQGVEEDTAVEDKRPEKTAKVNIDPSTNPHSDGLPTRTPGPISRPTLPSKTPSFGSVGPSQPGSQGKIASSSTPISDDQRSDISRVTKALDELREKTAAKELAKQKAALSASISANAARVPQAKSTGTGFLRGLGSIGAGLFGMGGAAAEEEAQRLAREQEEDRLAEEEFEKLMREATKSEAARGSGKAAEAMEEDDVIHEKKAQIARSTTPELAPAQNSTAPMSPEEEEEMVEEQSIVDDLLPVDPRISMATTQRQQSITPESEVQPISTTPTGTPTKLRHAPVPELKQPKEETRGDKAQKHAVGASKKAIIELHEDDDEEMDELDDEEEEDEEIEAEEQPIQAPRAQPKTHRKIPSSSSAITEALTMSTSSHATAGSVLGQAQSMAAKALGVKPATAPVKSLQLAAAAAKKEQAAIERKAQLKEADARRQQLAKRKAEEERIRAEEERVRAEEERKIKVAEMEEKRKQRAELEKRKREREEKAAAIAREKAEKERAERDAQNARMKAAEEEAARKRKMAAAALTKSQNGAPAPKRAAGPNGPQQSMGGAKGKEPFRPTKQNTLASSTSSVQLAGAGKMGPSSFRTAETHQTHSSTISLVTQPQHQAQREAERKALGPPSRPSAMANPQPMRQSNPVYQGTQSHTHGQASNVLQQSRVALQTQLDEKAAMIQSEDIVLPDIASEYSDSDDEDRTKDFIPPSWAESPNLRAALEAQASRDPDELFGPIKPLNMEELFKVRTNKFRARTSSANWSRGDGLTRAEEVEYAKRMGFKPMPSGLGQGSGSGQ
ncbi:hypothetical protein IAT40_003544 [Kwoniella sp. CBS 6097]